MDPNAGCDGFGEPLFLVGSPSTIHAIWMFTGCRRKLLV